MTSIFDQIGGEIALHQLVNRFYDRMQSDPALHRLHRLHFRGHGMNHIRQAQFEFLCGFLGGRQYYKERFGHMNVRELHAHIPIRSEDAEMWLDTFDAALTECDLSGPAVDKMRATLRRVAHLLVNDVPDWRDEAPAAESV